jgi:RNA polymerase sigma-70 factor (ECF subfamily)
VVGSEIDFTTFYETERDGIARSLIVLGGNVEAARDAVAEAFSRAYERWPRVRSMTSPTGWVYRVALNELRRRMRRRALESRLVRRERLQAAPPADIDPELWAAVAALPRRQREVIVLRYVGDLTEQDVARVLGVSEGAASAALVAARRRLADQLSDPKEVDAP